jgi:chorismate synthase
MEVSSRSSGMNGYNQIGISQRSVDLSTMEDTEITVKGRHDPCIAQRIVPVVEAAAAIAVFDAMLDDPTDPMES